MLRQVALVGRQEIVDDHQPAWLVLQKPTGQSAADKPRTADDKDCRTDELRPGHDLSAGTGCRWLWMVEPPCASYQPIARAIDWENPTFAIHPNTLEV